MAKVSKYLRQTNPNFQEGNKLTAATTSVTSGNKDLIATEKSRRIQDVGHVSDKNKENQQHIIRNSTATNCIQSNVAAISNVARQFMQLATYFYDICCNVLYKMIQNSSSTAPFSYSGVYYLQRANFNCKILHRLLQFSGGWSGGTCVTNLYTSNLFYLLLFIFFYCYVLIHPPTATAADTAAAAAAAAAAAVIQASTSNSSDSVSTSAPSFRMTYSATPSAAVAFVNTTISNRFLKRDVANVPEDEYDSSYPEDTDDFDALINNKSAKGKYIGAPCNELKCDSKLLHVTCNKETLTCGCEKNYPVQLGLIKGCAKPKKLGEQCFYDETCIYNDENSLCVQVRHNALCQCANGFHSVSYTKPTKRVFCTQDLNEIGSDLPTLLGVSTGIAVLAGLICMVLHLFNKTKYPRHRNFGDANIPPPIMYSSDTGIPLTVHSGRPSSRSSIRSTGSIGSYGNRPASISGIAANAGHSGSKGILVSTSRTGSRRPSLASVHSTSSSVRSYSMMRFEKEIQQKEIRNEMKLRLARLQQQQQLTQNKPQIVIGETLLAQHTTLNRFAMATPSPLTPNSLDELLPSVDETQEYPPKPEQSTDAAAVTSAGETISAFQRIAQNAAAYIGPCSSSTEAL